MKHALMYRSAISLISERRLPLDEAQLDEQREIVERHIEMEAEVIGKLEAMIPGVEDERISLILNAIVEDERRHHKLLRRVHEILVSGEAITEQDWWEAIWKDVPGLWT
jgi:rubrerythrin